MKRGAVLESLRVPTFTVVSPHEEVIRVIIKSKMVDPIKKTFFAII
jgi:hypothetical protein